MRCKDCKYRNACMPNLIKLFGGRKNAEILVAMGSKCAFPIREVEKEKTDDLRRM